MSTEETRIATIAVEVLTERVIFEREAIALALYGSKERAYRHGCRHYGGVPSQCDDCHGTGRVLCSPEELVAEAREDVVRMDALRSLLDVFKTMRERDAARGKR